MKMCMTHFTCMFVSNCDCVMECIGLSTSQRNDSYEVDLYNQNNHQTNNSRSNNVSTASTEEEVPLHILMLQQQQQQATGRRGESND